MPLVNALATRAAGYRRKAKRILRTLIPFLAPPGQAALAAVHHRYAEVLSSMMADYPTYLQQTAWGDTRAPMRPE